MTTVNVRVIRDLDALVFVFDAFDAVPGLEAFGRPAAGGRVVVRGKLAGLIAMDWIRDHGVEPVIVR